MQYFYQILMKFEFSQQIFKNAQISNFMKIHLVTAKLFHADRQAGRHDKTKSLFTILVNAPKNK
jgi:hypothetical protein